MHGVQVRRPEITLKFPVLEILRGELHGTAGLAGFRTDFTGTKNQQILVMFFVPNDPRVTPVIRVIALLRRKGDSILCFGPVVQVVTDRMHEHLRRPALCGIIAVIAGVEDVVLALALKHRAREDELILCVICATGDCHSMILVVYEIFGCGKIPAERLSERLRVAIVPLVEQEEFVALAKWHAVTEPSARELVIKLHIFTFLQLLCLSLGNRLRLPFEGTSITSHYSV